MFSTGVRLRQDPQDVSLFGRCAVSECTQGFWHLGDDKSRTMYDSSNLLWAARGLGFRDSQLRYAIC